MGRPFEEENPPEVEPEHTTSVHSAHDVHYEDLCAETEGDVPDDVEVALRLLLRQFPTGTRVRRGQHFRPESSYVPGAN